MKVNKGDVIAAWISCGAASAVAGKETLRLYGDVATIRFINNPIAEEDEDNLRFLKDLEKWYGQEIETATNKDWPSCSAKEVWEKRKFMGGRVGKGTKSGAPCTEQLKKFARQQWENRNRHDHIVLGFTADPHEIKRHKNFVLTERSNVLPVLIDAGITKDRCFQILLDAGLKLPRIYEMGYPNANCIGCIKASSATYWNHVRVQHPEVFKDRAEQSRLIGRKLARPTKNGGKRVFLDELDPLAKGRPMKTLKMPECGIFCEEKP